jgi:hypothetical protein
VLLITHYQRLLNYIVPDHVHVMVRGRIELSGGKDLALQLEEKGYDWVRTTSANPRSPKKETKMVKENATLDIDGTRQFRLPETHTHDAGVGLSEKTIHYISDVKRGSRLGAGSSAQSPADLPQQALADALGEQGSGSDRL